MYKVRYWFVTPTEVHEGTAMSTSPKEAYRAVIFFIGVTALFIGIPLATYLIK